MPWQLPGEEVEPLRALIRRRLIALGAPIESDADLDEALQALSSGMKLTPLEAELFRIPSTGIKRIITLAATTEQENLLKKQDRLGKARMIAAFANDQQRAESAGKWRDAIFEVVYASRTSVQAFSLTIKRPPPPKTAVVRVIAGGGLVPAHRIDRDTRIVGPPEPEPRLGDDILRLYDGRKSGADRAMRETESTRRPLLSHVVDLRDGRQVLVYNAERVGAPVLGPDLRIRQPKALRMAAVIVDQVRRTVEIRGTVDEVERTAAQFQEDLDTVVPASRITPIQLPKEKCGALKAALNAQLRREWFDPADEETTGIGATAVTISDKFEGSKDLEQVPGYAKLDSERERTIWRLAFKMPNEAKEFSILFNWREGRITFQHGHADNSVIEHVLSAVRAVKAAK